MTMQVNFVDVFSMSFFLRVVKSHRDLEPARKPENLNTLDKDIGNSSDVM